MNATSWIFCRLTQNEFKAITDQIQSEGGGSQTYIDLPKDKISDGDLNSFFGEGTPMDKGYKWEVPIYSLSLDLQPQEITISQRRDSSNCIREQNKEKRVNIWKSEYSDFPNDSYNESENPIYIFILKSNEDKFYAGWFYSNDYKDNWFVTKNLCKPLFGVFCGYEVFETPIAIDFNNFHWPFLSLSSEPSILQKIYHNKSRQVIYFGAPGTGKSHSVDKILRAEAPKRNIRTTFHPDSDYSTFVGCFKPTMRNGNIEYTFIAQAFINAYVGAWSDIAHPFYLVIEEINRGNCAQIFGDIFQLLDRNPAGESSYSIKPDTDLQSYIADKLSLISNIPEEIRSGNEMRLPSNLFIYATMNTSDQSLFPIDSAFKRRWDWKYNAIKPADNDHLLVVGNTRYSWTSFIKNVNTKIYDLTKSEDKQLGYWFIKPDENNNIDWELFVSKALFYIWNDIVKDYASMEQEDSPFGKKFSFTTFFDEDGNPIKEQVIAFLEALKVEHVENIPNKDLSTLDNDGSNGTGSRYSYVLDGQEVKGIGQVVRSVISKLCVSMDYNTLLKDFNTIVEKTHDNGSGMRLGTASDLGRDANERMRWWKDSFTSKDGKEFSVVSLWPDSYYPKIKKFVENYPTIFPGGLIQEKSEQ